MSKREEAIARLRASAEREEAKARRRAIEGAGDPVRVTVHEAIVVMDSIRSAEQERGKRRSARVTPELIRKWAQRGKVKKYWLNRDGHMLYDFADIRWQARLSAGRRRGPRGNDAEPSSGDWRLRSDYVRDWD